MGVRKLRADVPAVALELSRAAAALDMGLAFFEREVLPEVRVVRRGSKRLVPVEELVRWARENATRTLPGRADAA